MLKIKTTDIAIGSAMPYQSSMIDWLHVNDKYTHWAISAALSNNHDITNLVLEGCIDTVVGSTHTITDGFIYSGNEIFVANNNVVTLGAGQVVICTITESFGAADPVTFSDGTLHSVHSIKTIEFSAGTSGSGNFDFTDLQYLNIPVTTQGTYCQYSKKLNKVTIQGLIGSGYEAVTDSAGSTSWTLPVSCRPSASRTCYLIYYDTAGGQKVVSGQGVLTVDTNGKVTFSAFTGAGTARFTQLYFQFEI